MSQGKLKGAMLKFEWAKKHFSNLELAFKSFWNSEPYKINAKHDPQTRKLIYYIEDIKAIPDDIPLIAGDIIHALRATLDHIAFEVATAGGTVAKIKNISFPIFDDAARYKSERAGKIRGASQRAIQLFDSIQSYNGGNGH